MDKVPERGRSEDKLEAQFEQKKTGKIFSLKSVNTALMFTEEDINRVSKICNEPDIYKRLISYRLNGRPYSPDDAKEFIDLAKKRYVAGRGVMFFIYDERMSISGVIDLVSPPPETRLGYWNSIENPGVMTNALFALSEIAKKIGYKELYCTPNPDNNKSQSVLLKAGFIKGIPVEAWNGNFWPKYSKKLNNMGG